MTKEEIRTISLAKLELCEHAVLYDGGRNRIGRGGSGGKIRHDPCLCGGTKRGGNPSDRGKQKKVPGRLGDSGFRKSAGSIGTTGTSDSCVYRRKLRKFKKILACVKQKNPDVRIVLNAISLETLREVLEAQECGLLRNPEIVQVSVSRARTLGAYHMMTGLNPV